MHAAERLVRLDGVVHRRLASSVSLAQRGTPHIVACKLIGDDVSGWVMAVALRVDGRFTIARHLGLEFNGQASVPGFLRHWQRKSAWPAIPLRCFEPG